MRRLARVILCLVVAACALGAGQAPAVVTAGAPPSGPALPVLPALGPHDRVLVLAPHCDDETLACGGLLATAARAGAAVKVVVTTNGESFRTAARHLFGSEKPSAWDHIRLGLARQEESVAALRKLGLAPEQVAFLGYPDRGLSAMWLTNWEPSDPYTSPYTRVSRSPYRDTVRPGASYCGRSLVEELVALLRQFRPTLVLSPHPGDRNPDHSALYCYAVAALHKADLLGQAKVLVYAVHVPNWPLPRELRLDQPLLPPPSLTAMGIQWYSLPLDHELAKRKQEAITCYRSQLAVVRDYLLSFARTNELFGALPTHKLPRPVGEGSLPEQPGANKLFAPVLRDPAGDSAEPGMDGADLLSVSAARDGQRLWLRLGVRAPASAEVEYRVDLHWLTPGRVGPPVSYAFRHGHAPAAAGCELRTVGNDITLALPWPREPVAATGLVFRAVTLHRGRLLDSTAWALFE
jgi:LmbE family N-acetylglucosaminyl deacetylase